MSKKDTIIIMGNGPSLSDIDFSKLDGYDTFGLNAAYRAYERMDWWPTYHGCFDYIVTDNHRDKYQKLISDSPIKKCFYIRNYFEKSDGFQYINLQKYGSTNKMNSSTRDFDTFHDNGNSGANACSVAVCLGYKKIILLGVDCNYVEFVDGSEKDGAALRMKETPEKNPNYWFDDYQQAGDEYNVPRGEEFHLPTWNMFAYRAAHADIEIINCSPITTLRCFQRKTLEEAMK